MDCHSSRPRNQGGSMKTLKQHIKAASQAHAHLNVFASVVGALENGTISGGGSADKTAMKIVKLCKEEMQKQLKLMDAAVEAAHGITTGEKK